jgi:hypothetical protein
MLIPEEYLKIKNARGRSLREIGVSEVAFTRPDALDALQALKGSQAAVLGGDVLKLVDGKPRYTYDNWHVDRAPQETIADFLQRSVIETANYIKAIQILRMARSSIVSLFRNSPSWAGPTPSYNRRSDVRNFHRHDYSLDQPSQFD